MEARARFTTSSTTPLVHTFRDKTYKIGKYYFDTFAEATGWLQKHRGPEDKNWKRCGLFRNDAEPGRQAPTSATDVVPPQLPGVQHIPEEVLEGETYPEGAIRRVTVNAYERNPKAREVCLAHFGHSCVVCGFNFETAYGPFARHYIHVHHTVPVSMLGGSYEVNPVNDLRPVCPNCHAAIHLGGKIRSIEELKKLIVNTQNLA